MARRSEPDLPPPLTLEDTRLLFRNFRGEAGKFNAAGKKTCAVVIPENIDVDKLVDAGWNVKILEGREEGDEPTPILHFEARYDVKPPRVVLIGEDGNRTELDEGTASMVDHVDIKKVDLIITPWRWEVSGNTGIKGFLKSMFVHIVEDELEKKYAANDTTE